MTDGSGMMRILFVDDDVDVLDAMRLTLRGRRNEWSMQFVLSSAAALGQETLSADDTSGIVGAGGCTVDHARRGYGSSVATSR
jgi:hypothetical protein